MAPTSPSKEAEGRRNLSIKMVGDDKAVSPAAMASKRTLKRIGPPKTARVPSYARVQLSMPSTRENIVGKGMSLQEIETAFKKGMRKFADTSDTQWTTQWDHSQPYTIMPVGLSLLSQFLQNPTVHAQGGSSRFHPYTTEVTSIVL